MVKRDETFVRKKMLLTQLAYAYSIQSFKHPVKAIVDLLSCNTLPSLSYSGERALWDQLQDWLDELFHVGSETDAQLKHIWAFGLVLKEENTFANCLGFVPE